jgi:hypothetical protein
MPSYRHNLTGVPAGLAKRLSERKTSIQASAARTVERFGPWTNPEIWQWLIAKLPSGITTRVSAPVKGRSTSGWYLSCAWPDTGWSQDVLVGRIAVRRDANSGANS